ncbi:MAG TPA: hypothetical protein VKB77_11755 [Terriglobales bacterium]|nr:hypothetical protein [Terriglobales bacterium]
MRRTEGELSEQLPELNTRAGGNQAGSGRTVEVSGATPGVTAWRKMPSETEALPSPLIAGLQFE